MLSRNSVTNTIRYGVTPGYTKTLKLGGVSVNTGGGGVNTGGGGVNTGGGGVNTGGGGVNTGGAVNTGGGGVYVNDTKSPESTVALLPALFEAYAWIK
jgi:hypothetical protein